MARRKRGKVEGQFIVLAIAIAGIAWIASKVVSTVGIVVPIVMVVLIIVGAVWFNRARRQRRIEYLLGKYGDETIVERIIQRIPWQGQTAEQLRDSLGPPESVDRRSMTTRKREVWKYCRTGRGRYARRITLDNDVVIEIAERNP